ncbi:hypothetical protein HDF24_13840 [Mucilaginibacter sp. X4EP1]|uniref:hypothetical protein n=1 Tax=Mucilaginibacter sp. X4EP1 TaxID=2723092 RepID=UPI002169F5A7|nr:hypothetical protein [Mucilaginibacter sp. X4EP1]MCS3814645.1 putative membrane protein [Mucilaginibacter sp. X4EP1]
MSKTKFKTVLGRGIALAVPMAIVLYVFARIVEALKKLIGPVAADIGVEHVWGRLTLTIFAIALMILIILALGLLMQVAVVATVRTQVEDIILKFIPSLNQLKLMAADTLDLDAEEIAWKPVLLYTIEKAKYNPAFLVEEDEEMVTVFLCLETNIRKGEVLIVNKEKVKLIPITFTELHKCSRAAGKGYIEIIKKHNKDKRI